jgi:CheY-like chemotaxis protein
VLLRARADAAAAPRAAGEASAAAAGAEDVGALHAAFAAGTALARDLEDLAAVVEGYGRLARAALSPMHPARRHLARARIRAGHLREQVRRLVDFAPPPATAGDGTGGLRSVVERAAARLRAVVRATDAVHLAVPSDPPAPDLDWDALNHALRIVVDGIAPAVEAAGHVRCGARERPGHLCVVEVEASGDLRLDRLGPGWLDPEPLLAAVARDAPLGLSALRWICEELGATVLFEHPQPTVARWSLAVASVPADRPAQRPFGTELVLIVHGNSEERRRLKRALAGYGYRPLVAAGVSGALELLERVGDRLAVLVFDLDDPVSNGAAADARLTAVAGNRPRILVGAPGHATDAAEETGIDGPILRKPVHPAALAWRVRRLLNAARA